MELRDYMAILNKYRIFIFTIVIIATGLTAILTINKPTRYEGSITITVFQDTSIQDQDKVQYQFDNYYTLQAASIYADQLKGRFGDPAFVAKAFDNSLVARPAKRLNRLSRVFLVKKPDSTSIQAILEGSNEKDVSKVLTSAGESLQTETNELQQNGALKSMKINIGEPLVLSYRTNVLIASIIALIASLALVTAFVFGYDFSRTDNARRD